MRILREAAAVAVAALALAAPAAAGACPEPWQPYPEEPLTLPADRYCGSFDLTSTPVRQHVESRVLHRFATGEVEREQFPGLLLVDVRNEQTGETVRRNLSGRALVTYRVDGTIATYEMRGPVGLGWPQDDGYGRGFLVMRGHHVIAFDEAGVRSVVLDRGTEENLCRTLG